MIRSTCECCSTVVKAKTGYGIEHRERAHLAASAPCKAWSIERDSTFRRDICRMTQAELDAVGPEPVPPPLAPVTPRRPHGRLADVIRRNFFDPAPDAGEFPSNTIHDKEMFFSEPDY